MSIKEMSIPGTESNKMITIDDREYPVRLASLFKKVEDQLSYLEEQHALYLCLLKDIIKTHPDRSNSLHGSPTSPYFFDGQRVPLKHASLILRMIKKRTHPSVRLRKKSPEDLVCLLSDLWKHACDTVSDDSDKQFPDSLKEHALSFMQMTLHVLELVPTKKTEDLLPLLAEDSPYTRLFDTAVSFAIEFYTFSLELI